MEKSNNGEFLSKEELRKIYGPPPPRKPIPSNSFNTFVKILSLFPNQNPFSNYSCDVNLPGYLRRDDDDNNNLKNLKRLNSGNVHNESIENRGEKEYSDKMVDTEPMDRISLGNDTNDDVSDRVPCKEDSSNGSNKLEKITHTTKTINKAGSDEVAIDARVGDVQKTDRAFSELENVLMEDSDDIEFSRLPGKDVSFDILKDLGSMLDVDVCVDDTLEAKKRKGSSIVRGDMKEDVASEVKEKDVVVEGKNRCTDTSFGDSQCKKQKRCIEKGTHELSELEGQRYFAQKCSNNGELGSSSKTTNSIDKGEESGSSVKRKCKKAKKASLNDVVSAKHKHNSVQGEASNRTKSKCVEPSIDEKMMKKCEVGNIGKSSTKEVNKGQEKSSKGVQYTREQLLSLQNKTFVSDDILWAMQQVAAELYGKGQETKVSFDKSKPSLFEGNKAKEMPLQAISDSIKENLCFSTNDKLANEEKTDSSIVKKKKRGSSSEARKEKKKRQRRKKRAEMNKKLGVKRLKLEPILKKKVVSHCRHYLNGRCNEGDKCKFSHDVIPLTKSKPCCHFARNACMKGDECPFDHELSKYPCNNYVTTGSCVRGDSCSFSHKVPPSERAEPESSVSKSDSISLLQLEESNSKHNLNASTALAPTRATPNTLKGNAVKSTSQPGKAPKGISFLLFGKSSLEDSSKHKGGELSQHNSDQTNIALESSSKRTDDGTGTIECSEPLLCVSKCDSNSILPIDESGYATPNGLMGSLVKSTSQSGNAPKGINFLSFGKSSFKDSSKHEGELSQQNIIPPKVDIESSSKRTDRGTDTINQLSQGLLSQSIFSQMFNVNQVPSSSGLSYVSSGGKSELTDSLTGGITTVNDSNKLKTVQTELPDPSTCLGQFSVKDSGVRNTPSSVVKSLSSTLAFAEKYGSAMKMKGDTFKVVDKNGVGSDSGSKRNEESNASSILQFLYSGKNKEQG